MRKALFLGFKIATALVICFYSGPVLSQENENVKNIEPETYKPIKYDVSPPLQSIKPVKSALGFDLPIEVPLILKEEVTKSDSVRTKQNVNQQEPPFVSFPLSVISTGGALVDFQGISYTGLIPPDPNGDVGPNHYVQSVNSSFAVWNKTGTLLYGPAANSTIFTGFGGACENATDFDPIILYDNLADRWVITYVVSGPPYYQCIAVSQTSNPTGSWYRYAYNWITNKFNDYPKLGVWPDGYYLSVNHFGGGSDAGVAAFERSQMLNGNSADIVIFDLDNVSGTQFGLLPSDLDGVAPPSGSPNYFVRINISNQELELWEFEVDWTNTSNSTFTQMATLSVSSFDSDLCTSFREACISQPNTSRQLEAISDRLMHRLQYRNFGSYEVLMANHTVDADGNGKAGIRWYELRKTGSSWGIYQQGTYAPDNDHRWMGSIAMDEQGSIALGYTVSSSSTYPSIRITGRASGAPSAKLNTAEQTLIDGGGSQTGYARWGDYSMMSVDHSESDVFWFTHEYYPTTSSSNWNTRIGSFHATPASVSISNETISNAKYFEADNTITVSSTTIQNGGDVYLRVTDGGSIVLNPGFAVELGATFYADVEPGGGSSSLLNPDSQSISLTDEENFIENGSFEQNGEFSLDGWKIPSADVEPYSQPPTEGGTWALALRMGNVQTCPSGECEPFLGKIYQTLSGIEYGDVIKLEAWARQPESRGGQTSIYFTTYKQDSSVNPPALNYGTVVATTSREWVIISVADTLYVEDEDSVGIILDAGWGSGPETENDYSYFDLVSVTRVGNVTATEDEPYDQIRQFQLHQNYPNPFNPTTVISYQLPVTSHVTLKVFDMLGREVASLVNGRVSAGQHEVQFDASNLSSGLYIYRLQAGEFIETKKMMLIK